MTVKELYRALCAQISAELSMPWDNDGLQLCPDPDREVKKVLCTLDITYKAAKKAVELGCDAIFSHHPLVFNPIKSLVAGEGKGDALLLLAKNGISTMSFHTRYDALEGGMNDILASKLGIEECVPFGPAGEEIGRIGEVAECTCKELAEKVKKTVGAPFVLLSAGDINTVRKVAVCGGDGKDFIKPAAKNGADILITGRASYNTAIEAQEYDIALIECGHFYSEVICVDDFARRIESLGITAETYKEPEIKAI